MVGLAARASGVGYEKSACGMVGKGRRLGLRPLNIESPVRSEAKTHGQYGFRVVLDDHLALDEGADLPRVPGRDPRDEVQTQVRIGTSYLRLVLHFGPKPKVKRVIRDNTREYPIISG